MQTAIQLYTVRDVEKPLPEIIADVGEADFDGVEFAYRVEDADRDAVRTALDDAGLQAASAHIGIDAIEADLDAVVAAADTLGYDDVVVPWLDPEHWGDRRGGRGDRRPTLRTRRGSSEAGLTMHYHNHDQEFVETDEGVAFELLADQTDFMLELDAGWALAGGADPIELLHRYGDRISHVHLKDVNLDSDEVPALGEGDLDIPAVAEAAHEIGAEWLVYENDQPATPSRRSPRRRRAIAARPGRTVVVFAPVVVFARVGSYLSRDAEFATNARGGARVPTAAAPREDSMHDSAKYLIHADITANGVVERNDVVGAIFGQTEGLCGEDLDLRELQDHSKVGRIDVDVDSEGGQSFGEITIASGLDRVETALLAASLETIERVGPCRATIEVSELEDVRQAKRRTVVDRATDLLADLEADAVTSVDIVDEVRQRVRVENVTEYEGYPAGPRVADSDAIVVVEGRADVLQLLQVRRQERHRRGGNWRPRGGRGPDQAADGHRVPRRGPRRRTRHEGTRAGRLGRLRRLRPAGHQRRGPLTRPDNRGAP